ncbi:hypothetical protein NP233_g11950 [Leucocoprinus birnbaumii]|uniref:Uncharacterized protein n=1 Tax=Leucocoprinus birnbaumii TaxID=56174 RepID=A0AAD5YKV8_9AGAR|nr:hypothetical protein NP233_g11950 [Leucocoprinus birnbaumii]
MLSKIFSDRLSSPLALSLLHFLLLLSICLCSTAQPKNVTVDDAGVDPNSGFTVAYTSPSSAAVGWQSQPGCSSCTLRPDFATVGE